MELEESLVSQNAETCINKVLILIELLQPTNGIQANTRGQRACCQVFSSQRKRVRQRGQTQSNT